MFALSFVDKYFTKITFFKRYMRDSAATIFRKTQTLTFDGVKYQKK